MRLISARSQHLVPHRFTHLSKLDVNDDVVALTLPVGMVLVLDAGRRSRDATFSVRYTSLLPRTVCNPPVRLLVISSSSVVDCSALVVVGSPVVMILEEVLT